MNSFNQAVDYVNRNQANWDHMIQSCYEDWVVNQTDSDDFDEYVLKAYGIKMEPKTYNRLSYRVADPKKYSLFLIKFA